MLSSRHRTSFLFSASALILGFSTLTTQAEDFELDTLVITPSRTPTEASKVGSTVQVIEREEIEEQSLPLVQDYLNQLPGLNLSPNGGPGNTTTLIMRGLRGQYVKTLFEGIDISEVTGPTVQAAYGHLLADNIGRIEVLKGSQSTLYGSDAIAGVVNLTTLGGIPQGIEHSVHVEGGSRKTGFGNYSLTGGFDQGEFGISLSGFTTDGFSMASSGVEDDGYTNLTGTFSGRYETSGDLAVFASGLLLNGSTETDDGFPVADSPANGTFRQAAGRVGAEFSLFDGQLNNTLSVQMSDTARESTSGSGSTSTFDGLRYKLDYLGSLEISPELTINFGADWERQTAVTANVDKSVSMGGGWIDAIYSPFDALTLTAGVRHDEHSTFGGHTSWRATGSYEFASTGTRFHSSVGTGYRAPSLYELYAPFYGNTELKPETSLGFDIGVEQRFLDNRLVTDVTFFMIDVEDYIGYHPVTYQNIQTNGEVKTRGVEASFAYAATDWLDLRGAYTYTKATQTDGLREVRIPKHDIALGATLRPADRWEISATAKIALDTVDGYVDGPRSNLDDYILLNARVAYKPNENTELYLRGENLLDQKYEVVQGYNTPGFGVFAGFRAKFAP
ncbi:TonB-dependent receptor plug domain-containing protein [Nitratireductor sp. L15S-10]|uniref:TonB-dependent receptor plug domain-containing protein n=1 Tax=Nitratireductor sp. L15S-10 TaxID=3034028 RepID=UPI003857BFD8